MENIPLASFANYGVLGSFIPILLWYIYYCHKQFKEERRDLLTQHLSERREWQGQSKQQFDKIVEIAQKNVDVVSELKKILRKKEK